MGSLGSALPLVILLVSALISMLRLFYVDNHDIYDITVTDLKNSGRLVRGNVAQRAELSRMQHAVQSDLDKAVEPLRVNAKNIQ